MIPMLLVERARFVTAMGGSMEYNLGINLGIATFGYFMTQGSFIR